MGRSVRTNGNTTQASEPASSASEDLVPEPAMKKRKCTYYARKEAIDILYAQMETLQKELSRAREISQATPYVANAKFKDQLNRNHQIFAGLAAMLSSYKQANLSINRAPLTTFIHLPSEQHDRDRVLHNLHKPKVESAFRFMVERTRFIDLALRHFHEEIIWYPCGEAAIVRLDITSFEPRFSLRQVYEALKFYFVNQETILTAMTNGVELKLCSGYAYDQDFQCGQVQLSAAISGGDIVIKSNSATFLSFVEEPTAGAPLGGHAIATSDYIDQDDIEPHAWKIDAREELTSALLVTETMTPCGAIVTLSKWEHRRFRPTKTQPLTQEQIEELHTIGKERWETMLQVMHKRLEALW